MRSEKEKMLAGELYDPTAPEIQADQLAVAEWMARYNATLAMHPDERRVGLARAPSSCRASQSGTTR